MHSAWHTVRIVLAAMIMNNLRRKKQQSSFQMTAAGPASLIIYVIEKCRQSAPGVIQTVPLTLLPGPLAAPYPCVLSPLPP